MRIISQTGLLDIPYEMVNLEIIEVKKEVKILYKKDYIVVANSPCNHLDLYDLSKNHMLGAYSTEEKAKKAMEMCRSQYAENEFNKSLIPREENCLEISSNGTVERATDGIKRKYIFQFPADEEVE